MLHDVRARLLFSVFNHACVSADGAHHMFGELMRKIDDMSDGDKDVSFDDQFSDVECLSTVNEWVLISLARHAANDDAELHVKLRRDIDALTLAKVGSTGAITPENFQAVALMEVLSPVKHVMFQLKMILWK